MNSSQKMAYAALHPDHCGYASYVMDEKEHQDLTAKLVGRWIRSGMHIVRVPAEIAAEGAKEYLDAIKQGNSARATPFPDDMDYVAKFDRLPGYGGICSDSPSFRKEAGDTVENWIAQGATVEWVTRAQACEGMDAYMAAADAGKGKQEDLFGG